MLPSSRRNFFYTALAGAGAVISHALASPPMPQRTLGKTKASLPILGLGGAASPLARWPEERQARQIIERALSLGIRYFDTAANYGPSETFLGKTLPSDRSQIFVATKTSARDRDGAWRDLENSLKKLRTDRIDLWQFHALTHDWDLDTILDPKQGAIRAFQEARRQGIIKFVGITGHHNPQIIRKGLERYPFDVALIPINAADIHTETPFIAGVLPQARRRNVGIVAMKVPAYGKLLKPLKKMETIISYALSQPGVHMCIIAADNIAQLEENIQAAQQYHQFTAQELRSIEQKTAAVWKDSNFFRNWG